MPGDGEPGNATDEDSRVSDRNPRLSDRGVVAAVAAVACLALGLLAAAEGESGLAVLGALLAGAFATVLVARDITQGRPPTARDHLGLGAFCAVAVAASLVGRHYLTAAGLAGVALMNLGRWRGWKVEE